MLGPIIVNQILVSLDNSTHSVAALEAAVELAQQYRAALKGIFIEDINLLNLAEMPFCDEVGEHTARVREITTDGLSRGIFFFFFSVIRTFRKKTSSIDIKAVFVVLRGNIHRTIEKEGQSSDLIVIGKAGTHPVRGRRLGSTAQALIKNHTKPLLLIEENARLGQPIIVVYHQSPLGTRCLETGRDLVNPGETLVILVCQDDPDTFAEVTANLNQWATSNNSKISIQGYKTETIHRLFSMLNALEKGLLILPHGGNVSELKVIHLFINEVSQPMLLIRNNS